MTKTEHEFAEILGLHMRIAQVEFLVLLVKSPNFPPKVTIVYIWLQLVGATVIVGQSIPFFKVEHTLW